MTIQHKTIRKIVMLVVVLSLLQLPVQANLTKAEVNKNIGLTPKSGARLTGRLTADGPVVLNGNKARTGDTIFPGAVIETQAHVGATVQLGALGQLDLSPNTSLSLYFDQGNIQGELIKGCAILNTNRGVNGLLRLPRGELKRAEAGKLLNACTDGNGNELATGAKSARLGRNNGFNLGGGSVSWFEVSSLLASSGVLTGGLRLTGTAGSASGCCCCCCCNPSPSAPQQ